MGDVTPVPHALMIAVELTTHHNRCGAICQIALQFPALFQAVKFNCDHQVSPKSRCFKCQREMR